jgi:diketogulonate reductase-like aldo/keto reductase
MLTMISEDFIPIPGTKHVKYLKENSGAVNVEFSREDDERVRKIVENVGGSRGARYPAAHLSMCFGDSPEFDGE